MFARYLLVNVVFVGWGMLPGNSLTAQVVAVEQVLGLFDDADIVFVGERHRSRHDSDFRLQLVRHPDFPSRVDDVVVEFANSLYQPVLDDYLIALSGVSEEELSNAWRNTTQLAIWDSPIYEQFFRELRRVNEGLQKEDRIRAVAAGPPIDWSAVEVYEDRLPFTWRGWFAVRQIEREVLNRGRTALIITGRGNVERTSRDMEEEDNELRRLEALYPDRSFAVVMPVSRVDDGLADFGDFLDSTNLPIYVDTRAGPFRDWRAGDYLPGTSGRIQDVADALLYWGPSDDERIPPSRGFYEANPEYYEELQRRRGLTRRLPARSYN